MTFNNTNQPRFPPTGVLGVPAAGFASRGKGIVPKRLSLASAPKVGSISENPTDTPHTASAPRTSRSHLLAGLRTAPKTPSTVPASAPYYKTAHNPQAHGMGNSQYQRHNMNHGNVPHTSIGANFPSQQYSHNPGQQYYALPEQVLAPPTVEIDDQEEQLDQHTLAQLYATEVYLAQRQQQLQQMIQYQQAQQQFAAMNLNGHMNKGYPQTPITPQQQINLYNQQQLQNSIVTQEIPGQPGVYLVTSTLTGQSQVMVDPAYQQQQAQAQAGLANSPPPPTPSAINTNYVSDNYGAGSPLAHRSISPPKHTPSPQQDVTPLPPPSANAFRRGHGRNRSSLVINKPEAASIFDGPKSAMVRPVGMPPTPMTGTFGPGNARAGEHPIRQPYGPPQLDELVAKPTAKFEGSKNFAARQRRSALSKLVRAGMERRVARPSETVGSAGSLTPVSDSEAMFSVPSDNDSDSGGSGKGSGSLSGRLSIGSLRAVANGAIGSERKKSSERLDGVALAQAAFGM